MDIENLNAVLYCRYSPVYKGWHPVSFIRLARISLVGNKTEVRIYTTTGGLSMNDKLKSGKVFRADFASWLKLVPFLSQLKINP